MEAPAGRRGADWGEASAPAAANSPWAGALAGWRKTGKRAKPRLTVPPAKRAGPVNADRLAYPPTSSAAAPPGVRPNPSLACSSSSECFWACDSIREPFALPASNAFCACS